MVVAAVAVVVVLCWYVAERLVLMVVGGKHRHGRCPTLRVVVLTGIVVGRRLHKGIVVGSIDFDGTAGAVLG